MHIAFVTFTGLRSEGSWPATAASMAKGLEACGHRVTRIQPRPISNQGYWRLRKAINLVLGKQFQTERQESVVQELCESVSAQLKGLDPDLVLASSSLPVPYLRTNAPIAFWTDATFAGMIGFYPEFSRLARETIRNGMELEAKALRKADLAFYSSEWAARSAIERHGADPAKTHVVPFGPNLDQVPEHGDVIRAIMERRRDRCRLLYIGYDWERKQGDLVVRIHRELRKRGVPSQLVIIGSEPKLTGDLDGIKVEGLLNKDDPAHLATILEALHGSHFLVVPSKAECYGMVYAEAATYGLPSVALNVGGVPTVVRSGVNGQMFEIGSTAGAMAAWIGDTWSDVDRYVALARSTRTDYEQRLAWPVVVAQLTGIVESRRARVA